MSKRLGSRYRSGRLPAWLKFKNPAAAAVKRATREKAMPTINERGLGPLARFLGLLAAIRWEAQFKLAKCCMRASISISDFGVFLAEPVLERSKALNEVGARLRENAAS